MEAINFSENVNAGNHFFHLQSHAENQKEMVVFLYEQGELLSKQTVNINLSSSAKRVLHEQVYAKHLMIKNGILHVFHQMKNLTLIENTATLSKMLYLLIRWKLDQEALQVFHQFRNSLSSHASDELLILLYDYLDQMKLALQKKQYEKALAMLLLIRKDTGSAKNK